MEYKIYKVMEGDTELYRGTTRDISNKLEIPLYTITSDMRCGCKIRHKYTLVDTGEKTIHQSLFYQKPKKARVKAKKPKPIKLSERELLIDYVRRNLDDFGNTVCNRKQLKWLDEIKADYPDLKVREVKELKRYGRPSTYYVLERDIKYLRSNPNGITLGGMYG